MMSRLGHFHIIPSKTKVNKILSTMKIEIKYLIDVKEVLEALASFQIIVFKRN